MARRTRVVRKSEVDGNVVALLEEAASRTHGLFFANGAYTLLKAELRGLGMTNDPISVDDRGYFNTSEWSKPGVSGKVRVEYRQKLYTNSVDKDVFGKRVRIIA